MDKVIVQQDKLRLDQIVYKHYGDLTMFDAVLVENTHLETPALNKNDEIRLPKKTVAKQDEKLW